MKSRLLSILPPIFGLLLALGLVEIGIRIFFPVRTETGLGWNDRPQFYYRSPAMPTMQDYAYEVPKPASTFRIAVIGDSFTFAPFMQFTDTFAKKLEQILNINGGATRAHVVNYGVPAYSTSHEIDVTKRALQEGADLVLLQVTLNDAELKVHRPTGIKEDLPDRYGSLKLSGKLGWLADYWRTLGFVLSRLHNTRTHTMYIEHFNGLYENPRTWQPFKNSMQALVTSVKEQNKPIVAVVFPLFGLPMDDRYPFYAAHEKVSKLLTSLAVPHFDISDIYKGIPLDRLQVIPGVDRHPNEIAHRMAAERIYLWLEEQKLLPPELLLKEKVATRLGIAGNRLLEATPAP